MPLVKFSKENKDIIKLKKEMFDNNDSLLDNVKSINNFYATQEIRKTCKNCCAESGSECFSSFGVFYSICERCGHLNGGYEDSDAFVQFLYMEEGGENYKDNYLRNYDSRVEGIYVPKCDFLVEVLANEGFRAEISVLDIGCGAGHFVRACEIRGIAAKGYDPSRSLNELGTSKLTTNAIKLCALADFETLIEESSSAVVSMIGVLEHLRDPRAAISAFNRSSSEFLYISVPLYSFSTLLEHISPDVFPRQLSAGHTHLYTEQSLTYLANEYNLRIVGEWWFGTDITDLYRTMLIQSQSNTADFTREIERLLGNHIDGLQNVLDKNKICSEVHMVLQKS